MNTSINNNAPSFFLLIIICLLTYSTTTVSSQTQSSCLSNCSGSACCECCNSTQTCHANSQVAACCNADQAFCGCSATSRACVGNYHFIFHFLHVLRYQYLYVLLLYCCAHPHTHAHNNMFHHTGIIGNSPAPLAEAYGTCYDTAVYSSCTYQSGPNYFLLCPYGTNPCTSNTNALPVCCPESNTCQYPTLLMMVLFALFMRLLVVLLSWWVLAQTL